MTVADARAGRDAEHAAAKAKYLGLPVAAVAAVPLHQVIIDQIDQNLIDPIDVEAAKQSVLATVWSPEEQTVCQKLEMLYKKKLKGPSALTAATDSLAEEEASLARSEASLAREERSEFGSPPSAATDPPPPRSAPGTGFLPSDDKHTDRSADTFDPRWAKFGKQMAKRDFQLEIR